MQQDAMRWTIRAARATDVPELQRLVALFPSPAEPSAEWLSRTLEEKMQDPNSHVAVVDAVNRLNGYLSGYIHVALYACAPVAWVDEILVEEAVRRSGCGERLMTHFEEWAVSRGCHLVGLATAGAGRFYERLGYRSTAGYYKKYLM